MAKKKSRDLQAELKESAHNIWLAGLGAMAMAEEEGGKLYKNLREKGQVFEERGKDKVDKAKGAVSGVVTVAESYWETFERTLDEKITAIIHRIGVPTKEEIDTLNRKVDDLTAAVDHMRAPERPRARSAKPTKQE